LRNRQAENSRRLQVNEQVELRGLLHRQLGRLGPLQDFVDVGRGADRPRSPRSPRPAPALRVATHPSSGASRGSTTAAGRLLR
jgi:hypothetical protein